MRLTLFPFRKWRTFFYVGMRLGHWFLAFCFCFAAMSWSNQVLCDHVLRRSASQEDFVGILVVSACYALTIILGVGKKPELLPGLGTWPLPYKIAMRKHTGGDHAHT